MEPLRRRFRHGRTGTVSNGIIRVSYPATPRVSRL
jgi:hypothetical protein